MQSNRDDLSQARKFGTAPIAALVLAAGSSSRMGTPKALLEFGASVALELLLGTLAEVGIARGVVVLGDDAERIRRRVDPAPLSMVRNPAPARGRLGSLQIGLTAVAPGSDVLLWPVDRPFAAAATVGALLDARSRSTPRPGVIVPRADGRGGHPILVDAAVIRSLDALPPDANLRAVIRGSGAARLEVPVEDDGIHVNLDTPADYERALTWWTSLRSGSGR